MQEKCYTVAKMWEFEWWKLYKTDVSVKEHLRESFPYKRSLRQDQLVGQNKVRRIVLLLTVWYRYLWENDLQFSRKFPKIQTYLDKILVH